MITDDENTRLAIRRLRERLAARLGDNGVWFDSRAWIVTARSGP
ncbi:MAG TPA: hypothetical protein VFW16_11920 [Streptosporangiaceae bacterium]|nr:hypothetical protein [Streptosporangiaceae bacterium]